MVLVRLLSFSIVSSTISSTLLSILLSFARRTGPTCAARFAHIFSECRVHARINFKITDTLAFGKELKLVRHIRCNRVKFADVARVDCTLLDMNTLLCDACSHLQLASVAVRNFDAEAEVDYFCFVRSERNIFQQKEVCARVRRMLTYGHLDVGMKLDKLNLHRRPPRVRGYKALRSRLHSNRSYTPSEQAEDFFR